RRGVGRSSERCLSFSDCCGRGFWWLCSAASSRAPSNASCVNQWPPDERGQPLVEPLHDHGHSLHPTKSSISRGPRSRSSRGQLRRSTIIAIPWPPPTHIVSSP